MTERTTGSSISKMRGRLDWEGEEPAGGMRRTGSYHFGPPASEAWWAGMEGNHGSEDVSGCIKG